MNNSVILESFDAVDIRSSNMIKLFSNAETNVSSPSVVGIPCRIPQGGIAKLSVLVMD